jgi:hypothetical protein
VDADAQSALVLSLIGVIAVDDTVADPAARMEAAIG